MHWNYLILPIVTALIGWGTNVVAVKMLFHPREPLRFRGLTLHGVIPKRKAALARSLAEIFDKELLSKADLARHFERANIEGEVGGILDERLGAFLHNLAGKMPLLQMFLTDSIKHSLTSQIKGELLLALPSLKERLAHRLELPSLVEEKINAFSTAKLEGIVMHVAKRELKSIELLGGLLGLLIGLIQVALMALFAGTS